MTTFEFNIDSIKVRDIGVYPNAIESLRLLVIATCDNFSHMSILPVTFDPPGDTFTPYEGLTKQQVVDWAVKKLGQSQIDAIKNGLEGVIADHLQSNQVGLRSAEPPWSS